MSRPGQHRVRAVVFDAVGTLLWPEPAVGAAYTSAARRLGSTRDTVDVRARFHAAWRAEEARDCDSGGLRTDEARERRRWQRIVAEVFPEVDRQNELFGALWEHFAQAANWRLFDDVVDTWRELSEKGLALAVASNFDRRLLEICASIAPLAACRHVYASSLVGWRKPALEFFQHVAAALNLPAESILMIGDDYENDVVAARQAGWQAVYLSRERVADDEAAISSLREVLAVAGEV
ncbi:MAG: HAD-IA family hydrolase [Pirellulales bacterium]|nr:HAD-IA family hydrolase [Pirellulales bacterium]